jgi:3-deoxy-D-manno-octulosonic-acid transferase
MFYSLSIRILFLVFWLAQFFNPKAKKWIIGRQNWRKNLPKNDSNKEIIWFHCASLGEFDQGLPLMNKIRAEKPEIFILLTFFSPSGFENYHKRQHPADFVTYLPLDTKSNARDFISHFRPKEFYIVKYEFWCNFIFEAKNQGVKIYSICAIFRENQRFFKWYGIIFRKAIHCFDHIFVQNDESHDLLKKINFSNVTKVGDMRFDRVLENKSGLVKDEIIEYFLNGGEKAFILGSSWTIDEQFLKEEIDKLLSKQKIIIAPHDISSRHIVEIEKMFASNTILFSEFKEKYNNQSILIIDCIGKLSNAYSYGSFAYIGGGFTGKLHNILEPAVFGLPVIFGPKFTKFPEAQQFIDAGIGFTVSNKEELPSAIDFIQKNLPLLKVKAENFVENNKGVVNKIYELIP